MAYNNRMYTNQGFSTKLVYDKNIKPTIRKQRFSAYCKSVCEQSLITGFPVIASTSGLLRKSVKILVFIVSTCGFLYQTTSFLQLYRAYPTMVDIKVENPDVIPLPSVSICNKNRIRRKAYCLARPDECYWAPPSQRREYCWANPKNCVPWQTDEEIVLAVGSRTMRDAISDGRVPIKSNFGNRVLKLLNSKLGSLSIPCEFSVDDWAFKADKR
ncbi:uncharacterized protein NPIL_36001 [Nephila pilipes]|uniref:Uncharacterized protein n=1 Tax=Nephila pilipes TaxID=299642 RepID=A0A8X6Q6Q2_NEPPI|nr:uncharacterized protein NPIL_36001 [Nephila pilipes]